VKLDKSPSQIRNSEILNWTRRTEEASVQKARIPAQFNLKFRDLGFEMGFCPILDCPLLLGA
jgi:hypothetical protein